VLAVDDAITDELEIVALATPATTPLQASVGMVSVEMLATLAERVPGVLRRQARAAATGANSSRDGLKKEAREDCAHAGAGVADDALPLDEHGGGAALVHGHGLAHFEDVFEKGGHGEGVGAAARVGLRATVEAVEGGEEGGAATACAAASDTFEKTKKPWPPPASAWCPGGRTRQ
jgi:hypothetical protein